MTRGSIPGKNPRRKSARETLAVLRRRILPQEETFENPDNLHRRNLISFALFLFMVNFLAGALAAPGEERRYMAWIAPFMVLAFLLSRTRLYKAGGILALASTFVLILFILTGIGVRDISTVLPLTYFTATIFMVSIWVKFRWLVLLSAAQTILVVAATVGTPGAHEVILTGWLPLNLLVLGLILMSRLLQDRYETRLRQYRENLEAQVASQGRDLQEANRRLEEKFEHERRIARKLERALAQKDVLLKELHHRTKNNMQIVASLLSLQASRAESGEVQKLFDIARDRINSMAMVHEKLLESDDLVQIDLGEYLRDLAAALVDTYGSGPGGIRMALDSDPLFISIDQAIPLGLVVNELVTNSLKYAFPSGKPGKLRMRVASRPKDAVELVIEDDGVGLPAGFDPSKAGNLGYQLVRSIVRDQLGGTLETASDKGVRTVILFRIRPFSRKEVSEAGK